MPGVDGARGVARSQQVPGRALRLVGPREVPCDRAGDRIARLAVERDERRRRGDIEAPALVVDRCGRHARLDQRDPPAIDDPVVVGGSHRDGPAEVICDAHAHVVGAHAPPGGATAGMFAAT
jgi:hypothetical protein